MAVETDVLIIGAGPTGLMLGCELRRRGIDCTIVDRTERIDRRTRAVMVHAASLEQLDALGLRTEVERRGLRQQTVAFQVHHGARYEIDFSTLDTRFPYFLNIPQPEVEEVLAAAFRELGGRLVRGLGYRSHSETGSGVRAVLESPVAAQVAISARYLVGADGASSTVRSALGVGFPGRTYEMAYLLAEGRPVVAPRADASAMYIGPAGSVSVLPLPDGTMRVAGPASADPLDSGAELSAEGFQDTVDRLGFGSTLRLREVSRVTRYQVHERIADRFRVGRVLLAGDAAHLNSPAGGQAMNTGFGDASGLAWRLGHAVRERDTGVDLLDGYARERRAAALAVARSTGVLDVLQSMRAAVTEEQQVVVDAGLTGLAEAWSQLYLTYPPAAEPAAEAVLCRGGAHRIEVGARIPGLGPMAEQFTLLVRPGKVTEAVRYAHKLPSGAHVGEFTEAQAAWLHPGATAALVRPDQHVSVVLPLASAGQRGPSGPDRRLEVSA
jgi:2-polyprenyl-6-methoxyphenol hydroxylase-like FAD-dependent oxidoreductase